MANASQSSESGSLLDALQSDRVFYSAELRPPRSNATGLQSMDDWIDTYHSVRRLTLGGRHVFITDNAVGRPEEENLRHLVVNLGPDAPRSHITPFLTCKHSLDYCLNYAERAYSQGFRSLTVLGGDRHDNIPRCVEHAYELRGMVRRQVPGMTLGGWANPHGDAVEQVRHLARHDFAADFFLTQVVSHHSADSVSKFLEEVDRQTVRIPGIFGVFYYRSAKARTLQALQQFFPVPAAGLQGEFDEEMLHPDQVCARSIRMLRRLGITRLYISNLPVADASARLNRIFQLIDDV